MEEEIQLWLDKILRVKYESVLGSLLQQLKWTSDLRIFLQNLEINLKEINDVNKAIITYPAVGQLLGRLCTIPALLVIPEVYKSLMRCVMCFYTKEDHSSQYRRSKESDDNAIPKARAWAMTQLRNSVSYTREYFPTLTLDKTGFTQSTLNQCCVITVCDNISSICPKLENGFRPIQLNNQAVSSAESSYSQVCDLAEICSHLLHVPQYRKLMVEIVALLGCADLNCPAGDTLLTITQFLCTKDVDVDVKDGRCQEEILITLWLHHLPSLEFAVVRAANLFVSRKIKDRDTSLITFLVKACSEHPSIYSVVFKMLEQMWIDSWKAPSLSKFIGHLHGHIRTDMWNQQNHAILVLVSQYPSYLRPLVSLMQMHPTSLSLHACERLLGKISDSLSNYTEQCANLDFTLTQYGIWMDAAYVIAFYGSKEVVESCCKIMLKFQDRKESSSNTQQLVEIVKQLRGLLAKSLVKKNDIHFLLSLCDTEMSDAVRQTIANLFVLFVVHAGGQREEIELLLDQSIGTRLKDPSTRLESLVCVIERFAPFWASELLKGKWNRTQLLGIEIYLKNELEMKFPARAKTVDQQAALENSILDVLLLLKTIRIS